MGRFRVIELVKDFELAEEWDSFVTRAHSYDFYHLADYHIIAYMRGEGMPELLLFEEDNDFIALPVLVRRVAEVERLEDSHFLDITSVYGYPGPIASRSVLPETFVIQFQKSITQYLLGKQVVTLFSRLHPLLPQAHLLQGLGDLVQVGTTISVDLTLPPEVQWGQYRENHKRDIARLRRSGWKCIAFQGVQSGEFISKFANMYKQTMQRVGASQYYYFDENYFAHLFAMRNVEVWLFVACKNGEAGAAGIFTLCNKIVQYHLGATESKFLKEAPMKLVFDTVRVWAMRRGAYVFHLGGGVGGKEDSLWRFKAGFSKRRHAFLTWRWVLNREWYEELCSKKRERDEAQGYVCADERFFPQYRAPVRARLESRPT